MDTKLTPGLIALLWVLSLSLALIGTPEVADGGSIFGPTRDVQFRAEMSMTPTRLSTPYLRGSLYNRLVLSSPATSLWTAIGGM